MIRAHPATATTATATAPAAEEDDDVPQDLAMRFIEVGLAIVAIAVAGILALVR